MSSSLVTGGNIGSTFRRLAGLLCLCLAVLPVKAGARALVMGAIHSDPSAIYGSLRPMADYLSSRLASVGVDVVHVVVAQDHRQMVDLLKDGRIDWVSETPYSAAYLVRVAGAEIIARKWKDGVSAYRSLIIVRVDSKINSIQQLAGHRIGFQHPGSTTGFFLPALALGQAGLDLIALSTPRAPALPGRLGFVFSGDPYNTAAWVQKGVLEAGVLSDIEWRDEQAVPVAFRRDLRVIFRTEEVPRAVELVRTDLDPAIKQRLARILFRMHLDSDAAEALAAYQHTLQFDPPDDDALASLQRLGEQVGEFGMVETRTP